MKKYELQTQNSLPLVANEGQGVQGVQGVADFTQNYNRYSYALNNPLVYTDPDGEFIFTALAVLTGQLWALPITIGADFGALTGGISSPTRLQLPVPIFHREGGWLFRICNAIKPVVNQFVKQNSYFKAKMSADKYFLKRIFFTLPQTAAT